MPDLNLLPIPGFASSYQDSATKIWICRINTIADVRIHPTWRDVGPCRVRLVSLAGWGNLPILLANEEQFANLQVWKNLLRAWRETCGIVGTSGDR